MDLGLAYSEDFGTALRANALSCRAFVLHSDSFRILYLNLLSALHTICLHSVYLLVCKILSREYHVAHYKSIGF